MGWAGGILDGLDDVLVEGRPLLKGLVQCDFAQFAAHCCLRQLHDCKVGVFHPIGRPHRVHHLRTVGSICSISMHS